MVCMCWYVLLRQGNNTDTLKCICQLMDSNNEGSTSRKTMAMMKTHVVWIICQSISISYCKEHLCIIYVLRSTAVINNHFLSLTVKYLQMLRGSPNLQARVSSQLTCTQLMHCTDMPIFIYITGLYEYFRTDWTFFSPRSCLMIH